MWAAGEGEGLIGTTPQIRALREDIATAARSDAKVLITGETGAGKDVVARLIHRHSLRREQPFATLNCAGVPDSLIESELFGHLRGSFTDAHRDRTGILESAAHGTVFLDEVGEMSLRMQGALLRFLETGELQRVGATRAHVHVDVRVIAATNRDLSSAIADGTFRQDLYYRLDVLHLTVSPLRDRRADIPLLLDFFLDRYVARHGGPRRRLSPEALAVLTEYRWPGNVRELKNVVERIVLGPDHPTVEVGHLPADLFGRQERTQTAAADRADQEPQTAAALTARMLENGESFWSAVHAPFMCHDLSRARLREIVTHGLSRCAGNYRAVIELFNMPQSDYKRFLAFLKKHDCHVAYQAFRRCTSPVDLKRPSVTAIARGAESAVA